MCNSGIFYLNHIANESFLERGPLLFSNELSIRLVVQDQRRLYGIFPRSDKSHCNLRGDINWSEPVGYQVNFNGIHIAPLGPNGYANFYLTDQVDCIKLVTDYDGTAITRLEYLPYRKSWFTEGRQKTAPKYNGQEPDKEMGYYNSARYCDPEIARFITADCIIDCVHNTRGWKRFR